MKNLRKVSRTLLIATVMSGVVVIAGKIPAIENYSGQYAKAQELGVSSQSSTAAAAAARAARPKIRSVPSTGERAGKILVKAQEYISEEIPLIAEAKALLVKQRIERWNSTETAGYYQIMSSIAGSEDDLETVVLYYKKLLDIKTIPYSLRDQLTFSIGQIEFSNENYALGLSYLYDWLKYQPDPSVTQLEMFANAHYTIGQNAPDESPEMVKNYRLAIEYINWVIKKSKAAANIIIKAQMLVDEFDGLVPENREDRQKLTAATALAGKEIKPEKENWYQVLRALHNSLGETPKVLEYAEFLATTWPQKQYWVQLSNLYAMASSEENMSEVEVLKFEKKQLAAMELAHRQNMLDTGRELETMSQLYLYHDSPYQSSKTIAKSLNEGLSEKSQRNLELQSTAFINGKDLVDAVGPLNAAAELDEDGNLYMRLANVYLSLDNYEGAAEAISKALVKGGLSRPDQSSLLQGQAYLALENFDGARKSFREAAKDDRSEKMARNMLRYVDSEEKRIKDIREYLS